MNSFASDTSFELEQGLNQDGINEKRSISPAFALEMLSRQASLPSQEANPKLEPAQTTEHGLGFVLGVKDIFVEATRNALTFAGLALLSTPLGGLLLAGAKMTGEANNHINKTFTDASRLSESPMGV